MIPYEIDPSLYTAEPEPPVLDDGFSPPPSREQGAQPPADLGIGTQPPPHPVARSSS